jgi:hypothetical protein
VNERLSDEEIDFAIRMVDALPESEQMIAHLRAQAATFEAHLGAAKARISTLEALTDQLAEAVQRQHIPPEPDMDCRYCRAIAAYEADKEAHRG